MLTDAKRLQQIIKNLLSNAFKFTHAGQVTLHDRAGDRAAGARDNDALEPRRRSVLAFSVTDTGIGIPADKQQIIFEAFQQADGTHQPQVRRHRPGPGDQPRARRGCSAARSGWSARPARGSTFTLYLPQTYTPRAAARRRLGRAERADAAAAPQRTAEPRAALAGDAATPVEAVAATDAADAARSTSAGDDRDDIQPGDRVLLIVENDLALRPLPARGGARAAASRAWSRRSAPAALALAREYQPGAITLDIYLPDIDGWRVLERLKNDLATRHIPVCVISTDDARERALQLRRARRSSPSRSRAKDALDELLEHARAYVVARPRKRLLVVEPDAEPRDEHRRAASAAADVQVDRGRRRRRRRCELLQRATVDCVVVDAELPDMTPRDADRATLARATPMRSRCR